MLAELSFPAPTWRLIAHAHSWGADAASVERLNRLPAKEYQELDEVLRALGWPPGPSRATPSPTTPSRTPSPATSPTAPSPPVTRPGPLGATPEGATPPRSGAPSARSGTSAPRNRPGSGLSRAGQHKLVGEGLAVGLLALRVEAFTINRQLVESAFEHAWHGWTCGYRFPQVRADAVRNDIVGILRSSSRRKGPQIANWFTEGQYAPRLCAGWTLDKAGPAVGRPARVTQRQWIELAKAYVSQLNEGEGEIRYRRSEP